MLINVSVITKAKKNEVIKIDDDNFKVKVNQVPEKGKANKQVIKMLADHFRLSEYNIEIIKGLTSRHKLVKIKTGEK